MRWRGTATACRRNVLPLAVNEVTQIGIEFHRGGLCLWRERPCVSSCASSPRHDVTGLAQYHRAGGADPERARLWRAAISRPSRPTIPTRSVHALARSCRMPHAAPGELLSRRRQSATCCGLRCANCIARRPLQSISSRCPPARHSARSRSTLGAARSVSPASPPARPAHFSDDPDRPMLRFSEDACVQCGLCKATCPENVITLKPQTRFSRRNSNSAHAQRGRPVPLHPLRQTVRRQEHDRSHHRQARRPALDVYATQARLDVLKMCEDCRVGAVMDQGLDPHGAPPRPPVRTTDDYLREREMPKGEENKEGRELPTCRRPL